MLRKMLGRQSKLVPWLALADTIEPAHRERDARRVTRAAPWKLIVFLGVAVATLPVSPTLGQTAPKADQLDWVHENRSKLIHQYAELLAIPNVATNIADIRRNADHITVMMKARGLNPRLLNGATAEVPPAIYGEWVVPGARRTVVLYAHYDGQPVTAADWQVTHPFRPALLSGRHDEGGERLAFPGVGEEIDPQWRLYGRSASDDKLGVMAILAAVDALKARGQEPSFNLKIFFEGEEEAGSPNLEHILRNHRDLLESDGWVMIDGPAHQSGVPQVVLGVRGDVNVDVTVHGPLRPLHSGHYGNWAPNPAMLLSELLASMKDRSGRVLIADFYKDARPLSPAERAALQAVPQVEQILRSELGLAWTEGRGRPLAELVMEPSLNINGIRAAEVGEAARNVIPATATATLDLRLVDGIDHKKQIQRLIRHIETQGFKVLDREPTREERSRHPLIATVVAGPGYNAERTPINHPFARSVVSATRSRGPAVVIPSSGGSLPLYHFGQILNAPTVTVGLANHDNNQHGEDENIRLGNLWNAIRVTAAILRME